MEEYEGIKIKGQIIAEEFLPGTDILVSREVGDNIICKGGADAIATAFTTGTLTTFNYMVISTSTSAVLRATTAIPATRFISAVIVPTVALTATTSITTWVYTFPAQAGASPIWKFGMESTTPAGGVLLNEYMFAAAKDNVNNDLKLTYNVSVAP